MPSVSPVLVEQAPLPPTVVSPVKANRKATVPAISTALARHHNLPSIRTPQSAGSMLPSELPRSPSNAWTPVIKNEDDARTPITPPSAYTDFLKALSPAISTPCTSSSLHSSFSFTDRTGHLTPVSQPSSAMGTHCCGHEKRKAPPPPPNAAVSAPLVPPSPFVRPNYPRSSSSSSSGRTSTLRKLRIPQSAGCGPACDSPRNVADPRSPFSPTSWYIEGKTRSFEAPPKTGAPTSVSVKQVVTRTVTYTRTPLEPAPRGKRRKVE